MDIKTSYENFIINFEDLLTQKQVITQCNLDTSQKGGVSKIMFCESNVVINKSQILTNQIKVQGKTFIKIAFVDKENHIQSLDYILDFIESISINKTLLEENIDVKASIIDCIATIMGDEIRVQSVIELYVNSIETIENKLLTKVENAIYKQDVQKFQTFEKYLNEQESVSYEYELGKKIESIVLFSPKASIIGIEYFENKINVLGQVVIDIIYTTNGTIEEKNVSFTFNKEIETASKKPLSCPYVITNDSRLIIEGNDKNSVLKFELDLIIKGALFEIEEKEVITDLYSPYYELVIEDEYVPFVINAGLNIKEEKINDVAVSEEDEIDNIVATAITQVNTLSITEQDNQIIKEGVVNVAIMYENTNKELSSVAIEIPYVSKVQGDNEIAACRVGCDNLIINAISRLKNAKEIEVIITLVSTICICEKNAVVCIEDVKIGEEIKQNNSAISIYKPDKDEQLWDVAKKLGMSMEEIKSQNNNINDIMTGDENIIIYRELVV